MLQSSPLLFASGAELHREAKLSGRVVLAALENRYSSYKSVGER